uniref:Alpha amylase catalytic region n=1 Tax=uncultured Chloroflexota bacterium TaxID=166587 RepID=H5SLC0_9CHLR|nr:alpha amylase catalytic region [uncultured Chloroflexota bacterium]
MSELPWWQKGIIYHIYPRSFADSNGDGIGDLAGIIQHLDYLADLGVDAIWLSPIYPSPDKDFGYDVADYTNIDPRYGTLEDFDRLLEQAHARGIRVILDLVFNHTSDQHPWFQESRSSRENPKADWYIWQDRIPNNWQAVFGGRAWQWDAQRRQYYLHLFLPEQPDLNWRNPQVQEAIFDVVRFWLDRGVDGFRLDVFNAWFKDARLRSNPFTPFGRRPFEWQKHIYDTDQPEMFPALRCLRQLLDAYPQRYAVGETFLSTAEKAAQYCGPDLLHAAFNFEFTNTRYDARAFLKAVEKWEAVLAGRGWPNYVLSNHDIPRSATRYGRAEDDSRPRVVLALLLTLRGTPFLYYGEEIGMRDLAVSRSEIQDPLGRHYWPFHKGRDGARSPMQWSDQPYAGFSTVRPWLRVHENYRWRNVARMKQDETSLLRFVRRLIQVRRENAALHCGDFQPLIATNHFLAYLRRWEEQEVLVLLNFSAATTSFLLPPGRWEPLFAFPEWPSSLLPSPISLPPYQVLLARRTA